jgi:hypothetical protein
VKRCVTSYLSDKFIRDWSSRACFGDWPVGLPAVIISECCMHSGGQTQGSIEIACRSCKLFGKLSLSFSLVGEVHATEDPRSQKGWTLCSTISKYIYCQDMWCLFVFFFGRVS